jgi:hypothetical protein
MSERARNDPTALRPEDLELHQIVSFTHSPPPLAEHLERSPLFAVRRGARRTVAEWVRWTSEHERSPFPYGRVTVHGDGLLLEAFSDDRIRVLRERVDSLSAWHVTADERRIFQLPELLDAPIAVFEEDRPPRHAAELYLRMAWPFLPREDLAGRTPAAVAGTGRGRASLEAILETLHQELRLADRRFPAFSAEELLQLLLPAEPAPRDAPQEKPHSAERRRAR